MPKLHITDWQPRLQGLQKVPAVKVLVNSTPYGLREAKDCVDAVMEGQQATIDMDDEDAAEALAVKLQQMGATVYVEA